MLSFLLFADFSFILHGQFELFRKQMQELISSFLSPEIIDSIIEKITFSTEISFWIVTTILTIVFVVIQVNILTHFKSNILKMRKGIFDFDMNKYNCYDSINTIGGFIANSFFSFNFFFVFLAVVITPFCFKEFYQLLWYFNEFWLNQVILILVNIILAQVLKKIMTDGTHFKYRVCYQFWEFYKILTGFIISFVTGLTRYIILIFVLLISLFRVDTSVIPVWVTRMLYFNFDFVNRRFFGFLKCYHAHNHPIVHTVMMLVKAKTFSKSIGESFEMEFNNKTKRIAYKWQLCVLLALNPSLMKFRKHRLRDLEKDKGENDQEFIDKKKNFYEKINKLANITFNDSEQVRLIR